MKDIMISNPRIIKIIHWMVNKYGVTLWMLPIFNNVTAKDSLILAVKGSIFDISKTVKDLNECIKERII
jgi:hypothetical protein